MAIEKSLYAAPMGLDAMEQDDTAGPEIEIEIENPESVSFGVDGMPILEISQEEDEDEFNANLAESMDAQELANLAGDLLGDFDDDITSRRDWIQTYVDGLELLGLKIEDLSLIHI